MKLTIELLIEELKKKEENIKEVKVNKNGVTYYGVTIEPEDRKKEHICANIYLNQYENIEVTENEKEEIIKNILTTIRENTNRKEIKEISEIINNKEIWSKKIQFCICKKGTYEDLVIKEAPAGINDIDIYFTIRRVINNEEYYSIKITESLMKNMGTNKEELYKLATENAKKETFSMDIEQMLEEMTGIPMDDCIPENTLTVLTNKAKVNGASQMLCTNILDEIIEKYNLGEKIYIIPCSIHETIIIKEKDLNNTYGLIQIIKEINNTEVRPEDRLTDSLYEYNYLTKKYATHTK